MKKQTIKIEKNINIGSIGLCQKGDVVEVAADAASIYVKKGFAKESTLVARKKAD